MTEHELRVVPSKRPLPRAEQLAWKLAALATDAVGTAKVLGDADVVEMIINRVIDNAAVARQPRPRARRGRPGAGAGASPPGGATMFGRASDAP